MLFTEKNKVFIIGTYVKRQTMGNNCAPFLSDVFLYSYETDFIDGASEEKRKTNLFSRSAI